MGLIRNQADGQTPLSEEEKDGLLIRTITTRGELDEFEQQNIEDALQWLMGRSFSAEMVFREDFIREIHQRMFGQVWAWSGKFRRTNKNLGVDKWRIGTTLKLLLDDLKYWFEHRSYPPDEIAIRFKHRIVSIHCFPNGNGRHSRLMADIIIEKLFAKPVFSWGASGGYAPSDLRTAYLVALRAADQGDYSPLVAFARS